MKWRLLLLLFFVISGIAAIAQQKQHSADIEKVSPALQRLLEEPTRFKTENTHRNLYKIICANQNELFSAFTKLGRQPSIKQYFPAYELYLVEVTDSILLQSLIKLPSVRYADLFHLPKEELEVGNFDPSANLINVLHKDYPFSNGLGLTASIKENVFDTLDIDFRGRYVATGTASPTFSTHASVMATLVGGAGNTSAGSLGVSPAVNLASSSFANLLPDAATIFQQNNISVQNHSYGTVVENFYGAEARAYDQQLNALPTLVHVFSAGNSGAVTSSAGPYAGLPGVANTTGNFKSAKNVIVVAATDSLYNIPAAISKGPVFDGRLKPELTAFGEDGSSGAAAIVSGTVVSLQHLYRQMQGSLPEAALLRAALFNSADDVGPPGIDYASGYGSLNALKAAELIAKSNYFSGSAVQGSVRIFSVTIPAGIRKAKFTLAWNDPAANLLASRALVNNLDMEVVRLSDNTSFKPWVLNPFPHPDSLKQLPQRKTDTLNNAEQVTFDGPIAGTYEIRVYGSAIPLGPQSFHIAYQLDPSSEFGFTHPVLTNQFAAGRPNLIRWTRGRTGTGTLQYTLDGIGWKDISSNIDLASGYYMWPAPDTFSTAQLRITGPFGATSDTFVISRQPVLRIGFDCPEDFMLFWNREKAAGHYELFRLGEKYMETFATLPDTFAVYSKNAQPSLHYAVRALLPNGKAGQRSFAYNYTTQGVGCYVKTFLAELNGEQASIKLELATTYGLKGILIEKQTSGGFIPFAKEDNPAQLTYQFTDNALKTGLNVYRLSLIRSSAQVSENSLASVYYFGRQPYLVYPNPVPAGGSFRIISSTLNKAVLNVYNMAGQLVIYTRIGRSEEQFSTSRLQAGMYVYVISEEGATVQRGKILVY